jgi:hypothetical protein
MTFDMAKKGAALRLGNRHPNSGLFPVISLSMHIVMTCQDERSHVLWLTRIATVPVGCAGDPAAFTRQSRAT